MNKHALFFGTSKIHYALPRIDINIKDHEYTKTHVVRFILHKPITQVQAKMVKDLYEHLEPNAAFIPAVTFIKNGVWLEMKLAYVNIIYRQNLVLFEFESEFVKETRHDTNFNGISETCARYMESTA